MSLVKQGPAKTCGLNRKYSFIAGMSEGTGPQATTTRHIPNQFKLGSVGKNFVGIEIKIDSPDPATGDGEASCLHGNT